MNIYIYRHTNGASLVAQTIICLQCRRPRFDPWGGEDPLEKEMATHSSILAWSIPWTGNPVELYGVYTAYGVVKSQTGLSD